MLSDPNAGTRVDDSKMVIRLNVGGCYFNTQLQTLRAHPASILAQMFTPPYAAPRDMRDGSYFIDRNGEVFGYILDYLRTQTLVVPRDPVLYVVLRRELCFYGLPIAIQLPIVRPLMWEAAPIRYRHARVVVDEIDKYVEWEEGTLPPDLLQHTLFEIVAFLSNRGYKVVSEYTTKGSKGLVSLWLRKKETHPGADIAIELRDTQKPVGFVSTSAALLPPAMQQLGLPQPQSGPRGGLSIGSASPQGGQQQGGQQQPATALPSYARPPLGGAHPYNLPLSDESPPMAYRPSESPYTSPEENRNRETSVPQQPQGVPQQPQGVPQQPQGVPQQSYYPPPQSLPQATAEGMASPNPTEQRPPALMAQRKLPPPTVAPPQQVRPDMGEPHPAAGKAIGRLPLSTSASLGARDDKAVGQRPVGRLQTAQLPAGSPPQPAARTAATQPPSVVPQPLRQPLQPALPGDGKAS